MGVTDSVQLSQSLAKALLTDGSTVCGTVCGSCLGPSWSKVCQHLYLAACVFRSVWQGASVYFFIVSVVCGAMHGWYMQGPSWGRVSLLFFFICGVWDSAWVVPESFMVQGKSTLVLSVVCGTMPGRYPGFQGAR